MVDLPVRQCEFCGKEFTPKMRTNRFCPGPHYTECEVCGGQVLQRKPGVKILRFCSKKCSGVYHRAHRPVVECVCQFDGCGREFTADRSTAKYCPGPHYRTCVVCGKKFEVDVYQPSLSCSKACSRGLIDYEARQRKHDATVTERYGVKNVSQVAEVKAKKVETLMAHYGVTNPSLSPEVRAKRERTFIERFGVRSPMMSEEVQARGRATVLERYGSECVFTAPGFAERNRVTMLERYGVENIFQLPEVQKRAAASGGRVSKVNLGWKARLEEVTGHRFDTEVAFGSAGDGGGVWCADLGCGGVLVDVNPSFSHNSTVSFAHATGRCTEFVESGSCGRKRHLPVEPRHHQERALVAESAGVTLMQYFDWMDEGIFSSMVAAKLGACPYSVGARECEVVSLSQADANRFFRENHLLGAANGQTFCVGLTYRGDLVHVQSYGPARFRSSVEWEAIRSCSRLGWHVQGGFSRCDSVFFREVDPVSVVSYVDLATGTGRTESMFAGWVAERVGRPNSMWVRVVGGEGPAYVRDSAARRVGADRLLGFEVGDRYPRFREDGSRVSNADVLQMEGYVQVFDCGVRPFMWRKGQ